MTEAVIAGIIVGMVGIWAAWLVGYAAGRRDEKGLHMVTFTTTGDATFYGDRTAGDFDS